MEAFYFLQLSNQLNFLNLCHNISFVGEMLQDVRRKLFHHYLDVLTLPNCLDRCYIKLTILLISELLLIFVQQNYKDMLFLCHSAWYTALPYALTSYFHVTFMPYIYTVHLCHCTSHTVCGTILLAGTLL